MARDRIYVYILKTKRGGYYTGITDNLKRRIKEHREGAGARYVRAFGFGGVVYLELCSSRSKAMRREIEIKKMSREEKAELIMRFRRRIKTRQS